MDFIPGFGGRYAATKDGHIWSSNYRANYKLGSFLKQHTDRLGYKTISLYKNKKKHTYKVHRLIAKTFLPNPNSKPFINHIDADKTNNRVENLEWVTELENSQHANSLGLLTSRTPGEVNGMSKLTEEDVLIIRRLRKDGFSITKIMPRYPQISRAALQLAASGGTWIHLPL